jgi:hypothetical protein
MSCQERPYLSCILDERIYGREIHAASGSVHCSWANKFALCRGAAGPGDGGPRPDLRRLRHHAPVDATGRDYLVWERPGAEPLAVVATMAAAALRYLVLRITAERPQESED